jgi:predicted NBD/HSP70 family sugar kinase
MPPPMPCDNEAGEALAEAGSALGIGIANLINIFNPQMIVMGDL